MLPSTWKDADGYKLQFEASCSDTDKTFYVSNYPKVDLVADKRIHCTTCDVHIGSAPIAEKIVRTHEVLAVTQCNKCHAFYVSQRRGRLDLNSLLKLSIFRTLVSLERAKMARSITADGAAKEAKFSAAQRAHLSSATNASK